MYPTKPNNTKQKAVATVLTLLAVVIITGSVSAYNHKNSASGAVVDSSPSTTPATNTQTSTPTPSSEGSTTNTASNYKDGTYSANTDYFVPPGEESIKVTLTVQNGVVTNSQIINSENDRESAAYQEDFASKYKSYVVGKKLSDIHLAYISGASDTVQGFNDALDKIRNQAQA